MDDRRTGTTAHAVTGLFPRGRLVTIPRKVARREQLPGYPARPPCVPGRVYREAEVNEAPRRVHDDCPALRRFLVEGGQLVRPKDGSAYRRAG